MSPAAASSIWWVRRDLRLADNPALRRAIDEGDGVLPLFVLDPVLLSSAGTSRRAWLMAALHALDADLRSAGGPGLSVVRGKPSSAVPRVAKAVGAKTVHIAADFAPYGRRRDDAVAKVLAAQDRELVATGSPYAVAPGTLHNQAGDPFQVFSPFHRSWLDHGVHEPAPAVRASGVDWLEAENRGDIPQADPDLIKMAGEAAACRSWQAWLKKDHGGVNDYPRFHNLPGPDATSHLSIALRWGHLHARTVLHDLSSHRPKGALALARQIAWRDFFADVLFHRPDAVSEPIKASFKKMTYDDLDRSELAATRLKAWQEGKTGFPLVDAGMRQLLSEGWMHNRVRMVVASFLIKDLHIDWVHGARWFMEQLRDGDIAQNQLNWQWVAGCGTDAAPFFRVFNPTGQAEKFDADGAYIKRYVPELADVRLDHLHEPGSAPSGLPDGYPEPIVDHAAERKEALRRYEMTRSSLE
jgi:deoxyribodipyrimidine photo-lyase